MKIKSSIQAIKRILSCILPFLLAVFLFGCEALPYVKEKDNQFKVQVKLSETNSYEEVEKLLSEKGTCKNGFEILSTSKFMYGCLILGFLPGDCIGIEYIGRCK